MSIANKNNFLPYKKLFSLPQLIGLRYYLQGSFFLFYLGMEKQTKNEDSLVKRIIEGLKDRLIEIDEEIGVIMKLLEIYSEKEGK